MLTSHCCILVALVKASLSPPFFVSNSWLSTVPWIPIQSLIGPPISKSYVIFMLSYWPYFYHFSSQIQFHNGYCFPFISHLIWIQIHKIQSFKLSQMIWNSNLIVNNLNTNENFTYFLIWVTWITHRYVSKLNDPSLWLNCIRFFDHLPITKRNRVQTRLI